MKGKKLLFLFLALLLPVAIFIFLKVFGRNEFNVGVMYQDSIPAISSKCNLRYTIPYRIADSVMSEIKGNGGDSLYVLYFNGDLGNAIGRVGVEFSGDPIKIADVAALTPADKTGFLRECVLLMEKEVSVVLVDHRNRIRGYYDAHDRDEVDRLIVEIKIILNKY